MPEVGDAGEQKLLSGAFVRITLAAAAYFVAIGVLAPVLPRYVEDVLGGGGTAVGIAVGAFAVSAALLRPVVGRIGDARGRRILVVGGAAIAGVSVVGYALADSLVVLIGMRFLTGVGEAAIFVGAATAVQDLAPPTRRGEAASYFSVAVYGGLALGPILGEVVRTHLGFHAVWYVSGLLCMVALVIGTRMPPSLPPEIERTAPATRRFLHPAAIRPGVVLALSTTGFAGFSAFVPLYVTELGLSGSGAVFAEYAVAVLIVRVLFARLPDRLGSVRGASVALVLQATGLLAMSLWPTVAGLYVTTFVYALGVSLLYPALFPLVVDNAPPLERSQSVATFTLFFDVSQGFGALVLGVVVSLSSERGAFAVAGLLSLAGLAIVRATRMGLARSARGQLAVAPATS